MKRLLVANVIILFTLLSCTAKAQEVIDTTNSPKVVVMDTSLIFGLARKYGIQDGLKYYSPQQLSSARRSERSIPVRSEKDLEELFKKLAFSNKQSKIMEEYIKDFEDVKTAIEAVNLKKKYLKKYPEYLKDMQAFSQEVLNWEEQEAGKPGGEFINVAAQNKNKKH